MQEQTLPSMLHFLYRENRGQSAAMPACTLAFASLCLQNALMLLKSGEVTQVHESESVQENQAVKEEDSLGQETDASRYVGLVSHIDLVLNQLTAGSLWLSGGASVSRIQWSEVRFFMGNSNFTSSQVRDKTERLMSFCQYLCHDTLGTVFVTVMFTALRISSNICIYIIVSCCSDSGGLSRSSSIQSETSIPAPPGPPVKLRELPHLR